MEARVWLTALALLAGGCASSGGEESTRRSGCEADGECKDGRLCEEHRCVRWWKLNGSPPEVEARALAAALDSDDPPQILDVRTQAEWKGGHIPGAINIPLGELEARLEELPLDPDRPVVAICLTAHRSIAAWRLLSRHGYDIVQLEGGMLAWKRAKLPRVKPRKVAD